MKNFLRCFLLFLPTLGFSQVFTESGNPPNIKWQIIKNDHSSIIFPKGLVGAERMAHEMDDVAETLDYLNLPSGMTRAVREKLLWCSRLGLREQFGGDIPETIGQALSALEEGVARIQS